MNDAVTLHPVLSREGRGNYERVKMTFPGTWRTGVSSMVMRYILKDHSGRREGLPNLLFHRLLNRHGAPFCNF